MQVQQVLPRRFPGIRRRISLFLVVAYLRPGRRRAAGGLQAGRVQLAQTTIYFSRRRDRHQQGQTVVRLLGSVGSVKSHRRSGRGVQVELSVISERVRAHQGSHARLTREGYIGAASILLARQRSQGSREPLAEGDVIGYVANRGVAELVDDIKNQLTPVVGELRRMIAELNRPDGDLRKSLKAASTVLQELPETNREMRQLLRDTDRTVLAVGGRAQAALAATERVGTQMERDLPEFSRKLGTALDSIAEAAGEIRVATRKNGEALHEALSQTPALMRDGGQLVRDGQDVVSAAKNSWLLRDYVEPAPCARCA
jgi:ABC-type transporter Mla subunit MlaD